MNTCFKSLASLVLAGGLLLGSATPVLAQTEGQTPAPTAVTQTAAPSAEPTAAPTAEPTATPTATPVPTAAATPVDTLVVTNTNTAVPTATPDADQGAVVTPPPTTEPTATPTPQSDASVYVVAATVTDAAGGEVDTIEWGDRVNVVLRVVDYSSAKFNVKAEDISARINSSIFTYTGIGEIGQLVDASDNSGEYYTYVLLFRDVIYNGGGNTLPINLSYLDSNLPMQQFSVTLGQCVDVDPNDPSKLKTPNLVVRQSSYGNSAVVAGTPFGLALTIYATTGTEALNDVVVSVTLPDGITLTGGSLSAYVGQMNARTARDVSFSIMPSAAFTGGVANVTVNMTGTGSGTGNAVTSSTTISVPITQPDRFELGTLEVNDSMYLGESNTVTLNFVNKGKNAVSNVEATITGNDLGAETTTQYIGNINAGSQNSADFDLSPQAAGNYSGTVTISYESHTGEIKSLSKDFSFTVEEMQVFDPSIDMPIEEPVQKGMPVWGWVLIGVGVLVVLILVVLFVRKRKKAAALSDLEAEDEDDLGSAPAAPTPSGKAEGGSDEIL